MLTSRGAPRFRCNGQGTVSRVRNPTVEWLIETFGPVRAFNACMQLGGVRYHVLKHTNKVGGGRLSSFFSEEELRQFTQVWGGDYIKFPLGRRFCVNALYWLHGQTPVDIARVMRMSEEGVRKSINRRPPAWAKGPRGQSRQRARAPTHRGICKLLGLSEDDNRTYGNIRP